MPKNQSPNVSNNDSPIERRQQPRGATDSMDWETRVLKRVERHVRALSVDPTSRTGTSPDLGWEEVSILALRHRVRDLPSE